MKIVYISGPYSKGDKRENVDRAITFGVGIIDLGHAVIIPHLSYFIEEKHHFAWDKWIAMDLELLGKCDILFRIPGESVGADIEVEFAKKNGIEVYDFYPKLCHDLMEINLINKQTNKQTNKERSSKVNDTDTN